jgi:hypothetical protein
VVDRAADIAELSAAATYLLLWLNRRKCAPRLQRRRKVNQTNLEMPMLTPRAMVEFVSAEPFQPFRLHMASGRVFDIVHPEFIKVGRSSVTVYMPPDGAPGAADRWQEVSLMLLESVEPLPAKTTNGKI